MIEVVLNSITMAGINKKAGGMPIDGLACESGFLREIYSGARKLLAKDTVLDFLRSQNSLNEEQMTKCQDNFALSSAAYCVAT